MRVSAENVSTSEMDGGGACSRKGFTGGNWTARMMAMTARGSALGGGGGISNRAGAGSAGLYGIGSPRFLMVARTVWVRPEYLMCTASATRAFIHLANRST